MKLYNVEVFDQDFNYIFNTTVDSQKYKEDYLDPEKSHITIPAIVPAHANNIIRLYNEDYEYAGIISEVKTKANETTDITYTSIENLFDQEVKINIDEITGTYEQYIKARIDELYVNGPDTSQYLPLTVKASSSTAVWDFDYKIENEPDEDEEPPVHEVAFIKLLDDLIIPAFKTYDIVLYWSVDVANKTISVDITKNENDPVTIETALPNVIDKEVTIRKVKKRTNKVNIWNKKDFERSSVYYLHPDDTFDATDSDRITPVVYKNQTVSTDNNQKCIDKKVKELKSDYSKVKAWNKVDPPDRTPEEQAEAIACMDDINTFVNLGWTYNSGDGYIYDADSIKVGDEGYGQDDDQFIIAIDNWATSPDAATYGETTALALYTNKAYSKALSTFSKNKYEDYIEIEVACDDSLVKPLDLKIGQQAHIIHEGVQFTTVLSGRVVDTTATLIFGFVRLEFTKHLKGRD